MLGKEVDFCEFENLINDIEDIEEPIIVKRDNKKDFVVISLEEYQQSVFLNKLKMSKQQYSEGKFRSAKLVFKELKEKYGY